MPTFSARTVNVTTGRGVRAVRAASKGVGAGQYREAPPQTLSRRSRACRRNRSRSFGVVKYQAAASSTARAMTPMLRSVSRRVPHDARTFPPNFVRRDRSRGAQRSRLNYCDEPCNRSARLALGFWLLALGSWLLALGSWLTGFNASSQ